MDMIVALGDPSLLHRPAGFVPRPRRARGAELAVKNDDLEVLVERVARDRDRAAFAELFKHFAPRLKAFGLRQGADLAAAEELAQEAMVSVWRKAHTFNRTRATATTWVFTIVRNKRIDLFRRENRAEVTVDEVPDVASSDDGPDVLMQTERAGAAIREAIKGLPDEQLQVLQKAFFEDKSHSVIAAELDLPLGTVKSRVRLALAKLRSTLSEDYR